MADHSTLGTFLGMQGYGIYIWPAYAVAFAGIAGIVLFSLRRRKKLQAELANLESQKQKKKAL